MSAFQWYPYVFRRSFVLACCMFLIQTKRNTPLPPPPPLAVNKKKKKNHLKNTTVIEWDAGTRSREKNETTTIIATAIESSVGLRRRLVVVTVNRIRDIWQRSRIFLLRIRAHEVLYTRTGHTCTRQHGSTLKRPLSSMGFPLLENVREQTSPSAHLSVSRRVLYVTRSHGIVRWRYKPHYEILFRPDENEKLLETVILLVRHELDEIPT